MPRISSPFVSRRSSGTFETNVEHDQPSTFRQLDRDEVAARAQAQTKRRSFWGLGGPKGFPGQRSNRGSVETEDSLSEERRSGGLSSSSTQIGSLVSGQSSSKSAAISSDDVFDDASPYYMHSSQTARTSTANLAPSDPRSSRIGLQKPIQPDVSLEPETQSGHRGPVHNPQMSYRSPQPSAPARPQNADTSQPDSRQSAIHALDHDPSAKPLSFVGANLDRSQPSQERQWQTNRRSHTPELPGDDLGDPHSRYLHDDSMDHATFRKRETDRDLPIRKNVELPTPIYEQQMRRARAAPEGSNIEPDGRRRSRVMSNRAASASAPDLLSLPLSTTPQELPGGGQSAEDGEDDDVPLAVLAAQALPAKSRPSGQHSFGSTPNLHARPLSFSQPPTPSSAIGQPGGTRPRLPAFASRLPSDPYRMASGVGAHAVPYQPVPQSQPGGLISVIANEERARAFRRGSAVQMGPAGFPQPMPQGMPMQSSPYTESMAQMAMRLDHAVQVQQVMMHQMAQLQQHNQMLMMQLQQHGLVPVSYQQPGLPPESRVTSQVMPGGATRGDAVPRPNSYYESGASSVITGGSSSGESSVTSNYLLSGSTPASRRVSPESGRISPVPSKTSGRYLPQRKSTNSNNPVNHRPRSSLGVNAASQLSPRKARNTTVENEIEG